MTKTATTRAKELPTLPKKGASHQIWVMWRSSVRSLHISGGGHLFSIAGDSHGNKPVNRPATSGQHRLRKRPLFKRNVCQTWDFAQLANNCWQGTFLDSIVTLKLTAPALFEP